MPFSLINTLFNRQQIYQVLQIYHLTLKLNHQKKQKH